MSKYYIEIKVNANLQVKIEANTELSAISMVKDKFSKMEASNKLYNMSVEIIEVVEDSQLYFAFDDTDPANYQTLLMFG